MPFCVNCGQELADGAKFCPECGTSTTNNNTKRKSVYDGEIHKCPNCGEVLESFVSNCPACGHELRGVNSANSVKEFASKLEKTSSDSDKANLIRIFPIPNNKEDIYEFMILASTNIGEILSPNVSEAWAVKVEQCYQKAQVILKSEKELYYIQNIYNQALTRINHNQKLKNNKLLKSKLSEVTSVLPNIIIVSGWIISIFILIPLCNLNLDNVGTNSFQLLFILDIIAGSIFIPFALRCKSTIPKVVISLGLILSIVILIPLCTTKLDNVGTNAYLLLLIIDIICSIIIFVRMFKQK